MANKQKSNGQQAPTTAARNDHCVPFDEAVAEYQELEKNQCRDQMRQGELAAKVEPKYGDRTLAKFAKAVGKSACTLARQRSVYRAWEGIQAPGPVSYAVLRALQGHPDREAIVKEKPGITKSEAEEIVRARNGTGKQKKKDWKADSNKRWLSRLCSDANKHGRAAEEAMQDDELRCALREVAEPKLVKALAADLKVLLALAELLLQPDEHSGRAERHKPDLKEAAGVPA